MKIDACLIVKNEEENIGNVIEQLMQFSSDIYIVDTGSVDRTQDIVKEYRNFNANVHLYTYEWNHNFADARNYSISLSKDADYIFWCDGDEKLSDEFISRLKKFASEEYSDELPDIYDYGMKTISKIDTCNDTGLYPRSGIFKRGKGISFMNPIHEILNCDGYVVDNERFGGYMLTNYYDKTGEERFRNFFIFSKISQERKLTCRESFYLGNELHTLGCPVAAQLMYLESIMHEDIYSEVIDALYMYAEIYEIYESCRNVGKFTIKDVVERTFDKGLFNKSILYKYAWILLNAEEYELCAKCAEKAYNMQDNVIEQIITWCDYNEIDNLFYLVIANDKLGKAKSSYMWNEKILEIDPQNGNALHNKEYFKNILKLDETNK